MQFYSLLIFLPFLVCSSCQKSGNGNGKSVVSSVLSDKDRAIQHFETVSANAPIYFRRSADLFETVQRLSSSAEYHSGSVQCTILPRDMENSQPYITFQTDRDTFPLLCGVRQETVPSGFGAQFVSVFWTIDSDNGLSAGVTSHITPSNWDGTPFILVDGDNLITILYKDSANVSAFSMMITKSKTVKSFIFENEFVTDSREEKHSVSVLFYPKSEVKKAELIEILPNNQQVSRGQLAVHGDSASGTVTLSGKMGRSLFVRIKTVSGDSLISWSGVQALEVIPVVKPGDVESSFKTMEELRLRTDSLKTAGISDEKISHILEKWVKTQPAVVSVVRSSNPPALTIRFTCLTAHHEISPHRHRGN